MAYPLVLVDLETLPGLDSFIEPTIITGVWDIAREAPLLSGLMGQRPEAWAMAGVCSASLGNASGLRVRSTSRGGDD